MRKAELLLAEIARRGGMTSSQIQEFVVTMNGHDWNEMTKKRVWGQGPTDREATRRRWRGYWCDFLLGTVFPSRPGLLSRFCVRGKDKKYRIKPGQPIARPFNPVERYSP
jgi:hypothetical protein